MKKLISVLCAAVVLCLACGSLLPSAASAERSVPSSIREYMVPNATFKVSATEVTLKVGETKKIKITMTLGGTYVLTEDDKKLLDLSFGAKDEAKKTMIVKIKAKKAGDTYFYIVRIPDTSDGIKITVHVKAAGSETADELKVSPEKVSLKAGAEKTVNVTFTGTTKNIKVKVKDKKIASAKLGDWSGNKAKLTVKGLKAGSTTVEIYNAKDKTQKVTLKVTVKKK